MAHDLGMPTIFLRYNPDNFRVNDKLVKISNENRQKKLLEWVNNLKCNQQTLKGYLTCIYSMMDTMGKILKLIFWLIFD